MPSFGLSSASRCVLLANSASWLGTTNRPGRVHPDNRMRALQSIAADTSQIDVLESMRVAARVRPVPKARDQC